MNKEIYVKIYDTTGSIVATKFDFVFSDFTETINGGPGYLTVEVPSKFDDYGLGTVIDKGYEIKIIAYDKEGETTVYTGRIDQIQSSVSDQESVVLFCSGYISELALNLHESAGIVKFSYKQQDITDIIKDILDKHNISLPTAKVDYNTTSMVDTGKSITVKFFASGVLEAIQTAAQEADAGWFFRVGTDNVFYWNQVSSTPDHYFVLGKDLSSLTITNSDKEKITRYLFYNGRTVSETDYIFKLYSDASSERWFEIVRDDRFTIESSVQERANRILDTFSSGLQTVEVRVFDSNLAGGYDIESINVGDTCKFLNIKDQVILPSNGVITNKVYNKDYVDLSIEESKQFVSRSLVNLQKKIQLAEFNEHTPRNYTT